MIPWKHSPSSARAVTVSYAVYREGYRFASTKERDTWGRVWEGFQCKDFIVLRRPYCPVFSV